MDGKRCCPLTHAVREIVLIFYASVGPFLQMCILSLDSSTLPSASMTPGMARRAADRAGQLTAATLLRMGALGSSCGGTRRVSLCPAVCRTVPPSRSSMRSPRKQVRGKGKSPFNPSKTEKPLPKTSHDLPVRKKTPQTSVFNAVMRFKTFDIAPAALLLLL